MKRGQIVYVDLDPVVGREQYGRRPCVIVSDETVAAHQRFPLLVVVPLTTTLLAGVLHPEVPATPETRLREPSYAIIENVRCLDKARIVGRLGRVPAMQMAWIDKGLRALLAI